MVLTSLIGVDAAYLLLHGNVSHDLIAFETVEKGKTSGDKGGSSGSSGSSSSSGSGNSSGSSGCGYVRCYATASKFVVTKVYTSGKVDVTFHDFETELKGNMTGGWKDCYQYSCAQDSMGCYPTCTPHGWTMMAASDPIKSGIDNGCNYSGGSQRK